MKPLWINRGGFINKGALEGVYGKVVAFDSTTDVALLQVDEDTQIKVSSEMIEQDE